MLRSTWFDHRGGQWQLSIRFELVWNSMAVHSVNGSLEGCKTQRGLNEGGGYLASTVLDYCVLLKLHDLQVWVWSGTFMKHPHIHSSWLQMGSPRHLRFFFFFFFSIEMQHTVSTQPNWPCLINGFEGSCTHSWHSPHDQMLLTFIIYTFLFDIRYNSPPVLSSSGMFVYSSFSFHVIIQFVL